MKQKLAHFFKNEMILCIAAVLAVISCFLVPPDSAYAGYMDTRTLILLFCLMLVMAGLQHLGVFRYIGERLLSKVQSERGLALILIFLCFFSSMLITNDVALITFVPFGILILKMADKPALTNRTIVLMTIAANLGSMLTPIGNPQNLYLYAVSGMSLPSFLWLMLPYTAASALLLLIASLLLFRSHSLSCHIHTDAAPPNLRWLLFYVILFVICLLGVADILRPWILLTVLVICNLFTNRKLFTKVDYSLLLTFAAFFVFIGNMGRYPIFHDFIAGIVNGHEQTTAILASQVISNVPAALLLSGFTDNITGLIVGTNLGGLGTLIASMASLISYKQITEKGSYMGTFTLWNLIFLALLWGLSLLI